MTRSRCGNDPRAQLTDGDRQAVDEFKAYLQQRAAETQLAQAPFVPPAHYRRNNGVDCCVHAIPVGPDSCPACRELADDEPAAGARQDGATP